MKYTAFILVVIVALATLIPAVALAAPEENGRLILLNTEGKRVCLDELASLYGLYAVPTSYSFSEYAATGTLLSSGARLVLLGDVDKDGDFTLNDLVTAARSLVQGGADGNIRWAAFDFDGNGIASLSDLQTLVAFLRYAI